MELAAALCAHLCLVYGLSAASVQDHAELSALGLASDHADITHWLRRFGLSMEDFRQQVKNYMKEGVHVTILACEAPLYTARCVCPGAWLNLRAAADKNSPCLKRIPRGTDVEVL